jgi:hypothetical protein
MNVAPRSWTHPTAAATAAAVFTSVGPSTF